jgi:hypothetical protein
MDKDRLDKIEELKKMPPVEIFEYKRKWRPEGHVVKVHSDLLYKCKMWCRNACERWEWDFDMFTDVYEHTWYFEDAQHAENFAVAFKEWIQE